MPAESQRKRERVERRVRDRGQTRASHSAATARSARVLVSAPVCAPRLNRSWPVIFERLLLSLGVLTVHGEKLHLFRVWRDTYEHASRRGNLDKAGESEQQRAHDRLEKRTNDTFRSKVMRVEPSLPVCARRDCAMYRNR